MIPARRVVVEAAMKQQWMQLASVTPGQPPCSIKSDAPGVYLAGWWMGVPGVWHRSGPRPSNRTLLADLTYGEHRLQIIQKGRRVTLRFRLVDEPGRQGR